MLKGSLVILGLMAIVLVSACASGFNIASVGTTSIGDIVKNPENYLNKTITISGKYIPNHISGVLGVNLISILQDEQDYQFPINCQESGRNFAWWEKYKATGIIKSYETCICVSAGYEMGTMTPDACTDFKAECKAGSSGKYYYLQCTEPMVKI